MGEKQTVDGCVCVFATIPGYYRMITLSCSHKPPKAGMRQETIALMANSEGCSFRPEGTAREMNNSCVTDKVRVNGSGL